MGIREPIAPGPYAWTSGGYKKYEVGHKKISQADNEMRVIGATAAVPLMALALTTDGDAAAYVHMDLDEHADDDGERGWVLLEEPLVAENEEAERGVATAA